MVIHNGDPRGETGRFIPRKNAERERTERNRKRQTDESSLWGLSHCQLVNVKTHNYTLRESVRIASSKQQKKTKDRKT